MNESKELELSESLQRKIAQFILDQQAKIEKSKISGSYMNNSHLQSNNNNNQQAVNLSQNVTSEQVPQKSQRQSALDNHSKY